MKKVIGYIICTIFGHDIAIDTKINTFTNCKVVLHFKGVICKVRKRRVIQDHMAKLHFEKCECTIILFVTNSLEKEKKIL